MRKNYLLLVVLLMALIPTVRCTGITGKCFGRCDQASFYGRPQDISDFTVLSV